MTTDYAKLNAEIFSKHTELTLIDEINKNRELTIDGPISSSYNETSLKILWVLREPHGNGGGSLITNVNEDLLGREIPTWKKWYSTWGLIIKVSDAILNRLPLMSDAPPSMLKPILKNVAVINLNKFGGGGELSKHYGRGVAKCKSLVKEQISALNPNIIIYAGTGYDAVSFGVVDLKATDFWPTMDSFPSIKKNSRIHISAYHSGQRKIKHWKYCSQVIEHL